MIGKPKSFLHAVAAVALYACAANAQVTRMPVIAFTDTAGLRVDIEMPAGFVGTTLRARITGARDGAELWAGDIGALTATPRGASLVRSISGLKPRVWSPQSPNLYQLTVEGAGVRESVRIGFRNIASRDGRIIFNGRPLFLRGNAINPPERNIPDSLSENPRFATDYIRFLKSVNVNIIRLMRPSQPWMDAADEQGMLIFQGHYGTPQGAVTTRPPGKPAETLQWYRDAVIGQQANHPSVVIYALSNEQASEDIPYLTTGAREVEQFLSLAYDTLSAWDNSRLYITNAGYGFGRSGEICDLHRYWGWYYHSYLSFYTLRDPQVCWRTKKVQPITVTENTGNYTGVDGRFNLVSDTKQPDSQLNWTGHAPDREQSRRALSYQAWVAGQIIEINRRLRQRNPYLSGLSPFTIAFSRWAGITKFADMQPKPITAQYAISYQPVLLSWELWTPQVYAGTTIRPVAHLVNDSETGESLQNLTLRYSIRSEARTAVASGSAALPKAPYYSATSLPVPISLPKGMSGTYRLEGEVLHRGKVISRNATQIFVAPVRPQFRVKRRVMVYDPQGRETAGALRRLGVPVTPFLSVAELDPVTDALIIGTRAWDERIAVQVAALRKFITAGGRVLVLEQSPDAFDATWLPATIKLQTVALDHSKVMPPGRPFRQAMAVNPERPNHPVFAGIDRDRLFLWSDYTGWNESVPGFPTVYPVTTGFALGGPQDGENTAVLANYGHGLEGVALAEMFSGRGSVIVSGFGLTERAGLDPVADRLLLNLVTYISFVAEHERHPLINSPIVWGDYESERGLLTGIYSGLLLNTVPIVPPDLKAKYPLNVDADGFHFAGGTSGWNSKPSVQYAGKGRRVFGRYHFTLGGAVERDAGQKPEGEGYFWSRIPAGRTKMRTTFWNPTAETLSMTVTANGSAVTIAVPPREANHIVENSISSSATTVAVAFRGDRRLVIMQTDFR